MKRFHLIETAKNGLKTVQSYLNDMNASVSIFGSARDAVSSGTVPDMVVLLAPNDESMYREAVKVLSSDRLYGRAPRIAVLPLGLSMRRRSASVIEGESEFPLPLDREKFLSAAASCLKISQRRMLQIIITLYAADSNLQLSGLSTDFSETGMGFESRHEFSTGERVRIAFVNPRTKSRLLISAEIARKLPTKFADKFQYGAKYTDLQEDQLSEIRQLIA